MFPEILPHKTRGKKQPHETLTAMSTSVIRPTDARISGKRGFDVQIICMSVQSEDRKEVRIDVIDGTSAYFDSWKLGFCDPRWKALGFRGKP
jgi:hypothetical protein